MGAFEVAMYGQSNGNRLWQPYICPGNTAVCPSIMLHTMDLPMAMPPGPILSCWDSQMLLCKMKCGCPLPLIAFCHTMQPLHSLTQTPQPNHEHSLEQIDIWCDQQTHCKCFSKLASGSGVVSEHVHLSWFVCLPSCCFILVFSFFI